MMPAGSMIRSKPVIIQQLREASGIVAVAAQRMNVSRRTLSNWIREDEELQQILQDCRDEILDVAEGQLVVAIKAGSEKSVHFALRTIGRSRGYGDRVDTTVSSPDGGPVQTEQVTSFDFSGLTQQERDVLRGILERRLAEQSSGPDSPAGA
jgi:hypothetical protein